MSEKEADYYQSFDFLTSESSSNDDNKIKKEQDNNLNSNYKKSLMTVDKLNMNEVNLENAAQVILTEEALPVDPSLFSKSSTTQILESPEFNKKLRAQNEYKQTTAKTVADKKLNSQNKDMIEIIGNKNFEVDKFKDIEKNEVLKPDVTNKIEPLENIENETKQKIYRIKKNKLNSDLNVIKEDLPLQKQNNKYLPILLTFGFGITIFGLYFLKFRNNKLFNKFKYK